MECIIFLTHNFKEEFINTLTKVDNDIDCKNFEIIVLFDECNVYDENMDNKFKNIKIIKINKLQTSYDHFGHSMYINYFRQNYDCIQKYKYVWIIENDVYYPNSMIEFIKNHESHDYDLLVSDYGTREKNWYWRNALDGFKKKYNIGVYAFIMRVSKELLVKLVDTLDRTYYGYLEIILPHICIENNLTIQKFVPDFCGIVSFDQDIPLLELIRNDIQNKTRKYVQNKIYHPIKL
jgi:hypothetical protein